MKKATVRFFFLVLLTACGVVSMAQQRRVVTGTVRDSAGNALSGISFTVKGTSTGGATDNQGNFSVPVTSNRAVLAFTAVGFQKQEVAVNENSSVVVTLQGDANSLNEVVVTGFGTRTQTRKLPFSVQEVKGAELAKANTPNIVNALQGKVAGVMVNQGAGGPTSASRIRIRGNTSLGSNTQPLVVIDGVLIRPGTSGADSWGSAQDFGNQLNNLNVDDYESVTVLKGSAASALYGSEAQNGVLLITTKKGSSRKGLGVSVSHTQTFEKAYKSLDVQNEYGGGINPTFAKGADGIEVIDRANLPWSYGPKLDGRMVRDVDGRMIPFSANNDLLNIYQTGRFVNTNVAVDGGSERTTFRFSYTNTSNNSILPNNKQDKNNFFLRATQKLSNFITIDASLNYNVSKGANPIRQGGNDNPVFAQVYQTPRHLDINYWKNNYTDSAGGQLNATRNLYGLAGIFFAINNNSTIQSDENLRANVDLTAAVTPWLNLLMRGNINTNTTDRETKNWGTGSGFSGGSYGIFLANTKSARVQALLTATKEINENFDFSVSAGGETNRDLGGKVSNTSTDGGLRVPLNFYIANSFNRSTNSTTLAPRKRLDALYGYGDITYKDLLTLTFSARNDWSSSLTYPSGTGEHSYFYPSVGASYIFSESLKNSSGFDFLSFGKLRGSFGYTGRDADAYATSIGNYAPLGTYIDITGDIARYGFPNNTIGNQNLKNELTKEFEVGADVRFLQNRIGIDVSFYKKNSYNQIIELQTPPESGVGARLINAGNIQNKGLEVVLSTVPIRNKDFEWTANFNFTTNKNKIIELAPGVTSRELGLAFGADVQSVAKVGKDYGTIQTGYAYAYYQKKDATGNLVDHPSNGQKLIRTNAAYWRSQDAGQGSRELGTMMEKYLLSTINQGRYKNFTAGFQIDSKVGGLMASGTHQYGSTQGAMKNTLFGRDAEHGGVDYVDATGVKRSDGIIPEGVFADGTLLVDPATTQNTNVGGMSYNEAVQKGLIKPISARVYYARLTQWSTGIREYSVFENSWVALREVSLGYNMPKKLTDKIKFNSLRVSVVGRNLTYLYSTAPLNIHPEGVFSNRAGAFAEYGGLPFSRSLGVTINGAF